MLITDSMDKDLLFAGPKPWEAVSNVPEGSSHLEPCLAGNIENLMAANKLGKVLEKVRADYDRLAGALAEIDKDCEQFNDENDTEKVSSNNCEKDTETIKTVTAFYNGEWTSCPRWLEISASTVRLDGKPLDD